MDDLKRILILVLWLTVFSSLAWPCAAKPTREQIIALAERCKNEKKRMDLVAEFGNDFSGLDLSGVDFRGCHTVRFETNLCSANFSNCNLNHAQFGAAVLDGADFTGANLEKATFVTASLKRARFVGAILKGTQFYQSNLAEAKLSRADLSTADITGSDFNDADLSDATISGAKCDYWHSNFNKADLTRANLANLKLNGARFVGAVLRFADLSNTQLIQADFSGADLTNANFDQANVESAVFRNVAGLNEVEKKRLEGLAQRWKFELTTGMASTLRAMYFPAYLLVVLTLIGLLRHTSRIQNMSGAVRAATLLNVFSLVPAVVLLYMRILGFSSTVQFNAGNQTAMSLWSMWVGLWPLFTFGLLICLIAAGSNALLFLARNWRWFQIKQAKTALAYIGLTVVHCLFASHWIGSNFPSA